MAADKSTPEKEIPANAPEAEAPAETKAEKPVELIGGVPKQPTAEDLLKEELGGAKIRKAKGSKNITSGVVNVLASFNNTIVSITDPPRSWPKTQLALRCLTDSRMSSSR